MMSVAPWSSSTRSVWLMARVSQPPAMPAAVQDAGGVQQVLMMAARLLKRMDLMAVGAVRLTCQNSEALTPTEL